MNRRMATLLAIGTAGALAFAVPGQAGSEFRNKYSDPATRPSRTCDGGTVTYGGPLTMWPPNHKMQDVDVTATNSDGGNTSLTVTPDMLDAAGGDGGPKHDPDWTQGTLADTGTNEATVPFQIRSERSGRGDGRTYTIDWTANFDGKECTSAQKGAFEVFVPPDMRGGANWK